MKLFLFACLLLVAFIIYEEVESWVAHIGFILTN